MDDLIGHLKTGMRVDVAVWRILFIFVGCNLKGFGYGKEG